MTVAETRVVTMQMERPGQSGIDAWVGLPCLWSQEEGMVGDRGEGRNRMWSKYLFSHKKLAEEAVT